MATAIIVPSQEAFQDTTKKVAHRLRTEILDIDIPPPRCGTLFRQILCHPDNEAHVKDLQEQIQVLISEIKEREKGLSTENEIEKKIVIDPQIINLRNQLSEASKRLTRISDKAPIAMAVVMDYMVKEILQHAISHSKKINSKLIETSHIAGEGVQQLKTYALFRTLPSFQNCHQALPAQKNETEYDGKELAKTSFLTYVGNSLKRIKKDKEKEYSNIRLQSEVRILLSNLISECLVYLTHLISVAMSNFTVIRTISANHVKSIIHLLLMSEGQSEESINEILYEIDSKLQIYEDYLSAAKENKEKQKKKIESKEPEYDEPFGG